MADENTNSSFGDCGKMPSFDFSKLNRIAFEGWQALVRRQPEILQGSIKQAVGTVQGEDAGAKRMDLAAHAFETTLSNMRELAEMAVKSQTEVFDIIRKRVEKNLAALGAPGN